jgi:hypothetical protein
MFSSAYVKWLSQGGARVAPIRFDLPEEELQKLFQSLNGLLFTGMGPLVDLTFNRRDGHPLFQHHLLPDSFYFI